MTADERNRIVAQCASRLSEHFDSVQIFATKVTDEGDTEHHNEGRGNFYARYGQVREWVEREQERTRQEVRRAEK